MAFSLSDVTLALGGLAGNRGTAYAAGASAGTFSILTAAGDKLKAALNKAGEKIGPILGSSIPDALAAGAARTSPAATNALEAKIAGFSLPQLAIYAAVALGAGYLLWTLKPFSKR